MKAAIIYHSQSGNTKKIAQAIHKGISQYVQKCDIARLKDVQPKDLTDYDLIGLGSPVWVCRPSINILAFMDKMNFLAGKHFFYFCTHGTMPGGTISAAISTLRKKGLTVIGWKDWYGSVFLPYMPKPYYTDGHPDTIDLDEAQNFGREMVDRSLKISSDEIGHIPSLQQGKDYLEIYGNDVPEYNTMPDEWIISRTQEFVINTQKCNHCGLCVDNCPTGNIDFSMSPPVFKKIDCGRCWYCEQVCPTGAIEYDWGAIVRNMRQYSRHEMEDTLKSAEAKGRFRRLVPLEDVGWDTPWYTISNHPRLRVQ